MTVNRLHLPGYDIHKVVRHTGNRTVYAATRSCDETQVLIETIDAQYPDLIDVATLRRESLVTEQLADINGVYLVQALAHGSGNLALIGDWYDATLEENISKSDSGLPQQEVLHIALKLVQILGKVHENDIIHKALSPEHILYNPRTGKLAISGFGIASELRQERQTVKTLGEIEGPLPFISPEQTGRMNRDLDYRADYYSLGVILYRLLTGRLPYQANSALEWVHCHISQTPKAPHEVSGLIPEVISSIIMKLLAKNPEDRYQSKAGLLFDLEQCAAKLTSEKAAEPFSLASMDVMQKFLVPQKLYGRDAEQKILFQLFDSATAGNTEFCLVHGYSGVGKSALVNELDRPLVRERGFLIQGKFDQYHQGETYTAIMSAYRSLVQQILSLSEPHLALWRERIGEALSPNGQLLIEQIPELELIIGPQPVVAELPSAEARNRLFITLTNFLVAFAKHKHPVVLFLDDLQWSDTPTLELLRRLITSHDLNHLLIIGAYRSNEVSKGHPLQLLIDSFPADKAIRQLPLDPLAPSSVNDLVADALSRPKDEARPLSQLLYAKAQGNPFFTNALLRQLHKEGAIFADLRNGLWRWDLDQVQWANVSQDVVEFMVNNLRQLAANTQQALELASCIGGTFDLNTLSTILQQSRFNTAIALIPAVKQHIIIPLHSNYRLVNNADNLQELNPSYRFQHDRIQQAAYTLIDPQQLPEVHLSIGRLLLQEIGEHQLSEHLVDIVGHLNCGIESIDCAEERKRFAELNLQASERAKQSSDYEAAYQYIITARRLLPVDPWASYPELAHNIIFENQQCAYLTNRSEAADKYSEELLSQATTPLQKSQILAIRTRQYATLGRMDESIESAIQGLTILGIAFNHQPSDKDIATEIELIRENLGQRQITDLVNAKPVEDPETLTAMRLLTEIFAAAFLSGTGNLFPYLVLKSANLSLRHGNSPESAFAYAAYGMLLCGEMDDPATGYQFAKVGLAINERSDDISERARVIYVYAMFVHHWSEHWATLTPWFRKGIEAGYQSGDLLYLAYSAQDCVIWDPTLDLETAHQLHCEHLDIVKECAYQDSLDSGTLFRQFQRNLLGLTHSPFTLSDDEFDAEKCLAGMRERQFMTGIANYHIYSAELALLYGDMDSAVEHVRAQDLLIKSSMSLPQLVRFYIVAHLTLARCYPKMAADEQQRTLQRLQKDHIQMRRWADNCESNFRHLQYLMEAEQLHLQGDNESALLRYDAAIESAQKSGFLHDQATAYECAARHLIATGKDRSAEGYLRGAYHLYQRWGAKTKLVYLRQEFPALKELTAPITSGLNPDLSSNLDLASIMKASREISGEIVLDQLLQKVISILLENAGAQWGCIVSKREDDIIVLADSMPDFSLDKKALPNHLLLTNSNGSRIPLPVTLINQVLQNGEAVVLHNTAKEGHFTKDPYVTAFEPVSVLCAPIHREHFTGVVYMENNLATQVFNESRVEIIQLLAAQAAVAIENANLYEQVQDYSRTLEHKVAERTLELEELNQDLQNLVDRDGLTGVANRRRGDAYLYECWISLTHQQQPLTVFMIDVDHFKAYNDSYGHQAGDDCLIQVAHETSSLLTDQNNLVARYGGEEFMIILPNTTIDQAEVLGEAIRQGIEDLSIPHAHSTTSEFVTVSIGIAAMVPNLQATVDDIVREADIALYRAKRMGRNQLHSAAPSQNTIDKPNN